MKKKEAGITLVALVITIVIMLILAGVSISLNTENSSIFDQAQKAKEKNKIAQIIEYLDLKLLNNQTIHYFEGNEVIIRATQKEVEENKRDLLKIGNEVEVKEVIVESKETKARTSEEEAKYEAYFYVIVDKGVYKVTLDGTKYIGEQIEEPIEIEEGDLVADYAPTIWTNGNVKITLKSNLDIPETKIVYMKEKDIRWRNYEETGEFEVEENQTVRVSLQGIMIKTPPEMSVNILNIDKTKPVVATANSDTKSITFTATDEASGIIGYKITTSNAEPTTFESCENTKNLNKTISGLNDNTLYYIWIKDEAGNVSEGNGIKTGILTTPEYEISLNPSGWTNGDVVATVTPTTALESGTWLEVSRDANTWEPKTTSLTYENNGTMYVSIYDGTNRKTLSTTGNVWNIDKTKPVVTTANSDTKSITFTATDEASGIIGYKITTSNTAPSTFDSCSNTKSLNKTISGLKDDETYYIWIKDEAGNVSVGKDIRTGVITQPNYTFSYNPSGWTKGSVIATVNPTTALTSGTWIEVSKDTTTWTKGTSLTYENNGTMYVSVYDGTNRKTLSTTGTIANIDKTGPATPAITNPTNGNWTNTDFSLTLKSSDVGSGIAYYQYSYDQQNWNTYANSNANTFTTTPFSAQRNQLVYIRCLDNVGNVSGVSSTYIRIDKTGPATPTITNPTNGNWTNGDINITVESTDSGTGIKKIEYSYDQSTWLSDWSGALTINGNKGTVKGIWSAERNQQVYMRAVDNLGNSSGISSTYIRIDKTGPKSFTPTLSSSTSNSITISASTQDASSGIKGYKYSKDNGSTWQDSNTFGSLTGSSYTVKVKAIDNVGNETISNALQIGATYHSHSGSSSSGGGCYGGKNYHSHSGSSSSGGGCYGGRNYHSHSGSSSSGGGCYGGRNYHSHTSSCNHTHTSKTGSCYTKTTTKCSGTLIVDEELDSSNRTWGHCSNSACQYHATGCKFFSGGVNWHGKNCGTTLGTTVTTYKLTCSKVYDCGKTTSTVESYYTNCGKTTSTVESYYTNCGKTTSTVDSYYLNCGKNESTITGYVAK